MGNPLIPAAIGLGTGIIETAVQQGITSRNAREQVKNSKKLMDYQQQKQYEMWLKTNYGAQVEQLQKAGLNPALMYGMSGGGGTTTGNASATAPMQQTPQIAGMGLQAAQIIQQNKLIDAQVKNLEADANKKNIEAGKTAGVDTEEAKARIEKMAQETDNMREEWVLKRYQQKIIAIEGWQKEKTTDAQIKIVETQAQQAIQQLKIMQADAEVKQATKDELITITKQQIIEQAVRIAATNKQIQKTDAEINKMATEIQQQWTKLSQETRGLDQKDTELRIKKFEADIKAAYPGLWNVAGKVITDTERLLNKAFNETTLPTITK